MPLFLSFERSVHRIPTADKLVQAKCKRRETLFGRKFTSVAGKESFLEGLDTSRFRDLSSPYWLLASAFMG